MAGLLGDALAIAVKRLRDRPEGSRVLILMTDGANTAGEIPPREAADLAARYPFLGEVEAHRLIRLYGTSAATFLGEAESAADLGEAFGHGLTAAEVDYLIAHEWARTAADVLWRRTKLGLHFTDAQTARLAAYITERITPA